MFIKILWFFHARYCVNLKWPLLDDTKNCLKKTMAFRRFTYKSLTIEGCRISINQSQKEKSGNLIVLRTFCKFHFFLLYCKLIKIDNPRLLSSCAMFILSVKLRRVLYGELPKVVIFFFCKVKNTFFWISVNW